MREEGGDKKLISINYDINFLPPPFPSPSLIFYNLCCSQSAGTTVGLDFNSSELDVKGASGRAVREDKRIHWMHLKWKWNTGIMDVWMVIVWICWSEVQNLGAYQQFTEIIIFCLKSNKFNRNYHAINHRKTYNNCNTLSLFLPYICSSCKRERKQKQWVHRLTKTRTVKVSKHSRKWSNCNPAKLGACIQGN